MTGLSGSGKSQFIKSSDLIKNKITNHLHINFDDLRIYHPRYTKLVKENPVTASAKTDYPVSDMIQWLCCNAAKQKVNVIIDDTAMGHEITSDTIKPFKENGYKIHVFIISIDPETAKERTITRFKQELKQAKSNPDILPRWVNNTEQEASPARLIETVELLENENSVISITVIDESYTPIKSTSKPSQTILTLSY